MNVVSTTSFVTKKDFSLYHRMVNDHSNDTHTEVGTTNIVRHLTRHTSRSLRKRTVRRKKVHVTNVVNVELTDSHNYGRDFPIEDELTSE